MITHHPTRQNCSLPRSSLWGLVFPLAIVTLVVASATRIPLNTPVMLTMLAVGVVLLGLPHGALDPWIAKRVWPRRSPFSLYYFLSLYVLIAAVCAALWLAAPNVSLTVFLLISACHFASDWQDRGPVWGRLAYGLSIVTLPTLRSPAVVAEIYQALGASGAAHIVSASRLTAVVAIVLAFASLVPHALLRRRDTVELSVIVFGSLLLQPLLFFCCYFCLLHSPRHLLETARRVNLRGTPAIARAVLPATVATLALAAGLWLCLPSGTFVNKLLQIVFIGLAALTVPHMLLSELSARW